MYLGAGRREFVPITTVDSSGNAGLRTDNRNMIEEWISKRESEGNAVYVDDRVWLYIIFI